MPAAVCWVWGRDTLGGRHFHCVFDCLGALLREQDVTAVMLGLLVAGCLIGWILVAVLVVFWHGVGEVSGVVAFLCLAVCFCLSPFCKVTTGDVSDALCVVCVCALRGVRLRVCCS
ncbi:hypothetical protein DQ04_19181000 [Trypanosoma grayi]|uniref:hypothetical protein n=1 Tax=Trypanosoma grayi TaxID=71804 RepID=UPI0004F47E27|nr:hypothetical protein DQ04_19181000 [Trypanosoma grayi]KEG05702.1 hypothetical protein DQ04_19181000 [Trypanosoma grayi]